LKNAFRDKFRDDLTQNLNQIGVNAKMAERGRVEEKAENSWYQRSLGVIEIPEGPVKIINILKKDRSRDSGPQWWVVLGIPDEQLASSSQTVKIKTVRKKKFPIFGGIVDVIWRGNDGGTNLVNTLSEDIPTKNLAKRIGNLEIKSQSQAWTLTVFLGQRGLFSNRPFTLTEQDWETVEKIADYILSSPRSLRV
jgi:hypothetical protein